MTNENGGLPKAFGSPTESEEWTLNLLAFFPFLFKKRAGTFSTSLELTKSSVHGKRNKHPQAPQGAKKVVSPFGARRNFFFADEERRGGVAAIEQPR